MNKDYEKLKSLIEEGKELLKNLHPTNFERYQTRVLHIIESIFDYNSRQVDKIEKAIYHGDDEYWVIETIKEIETLLELYLDDIPRETIINNEVSEDHKEFNKTKIFIVHGHDEELLKEVKSFLLSLRLEPIILREQVSQGMTVIEKLEEYTDVSAGITLFTACDHGSKKGEELKLRARQNVVIEHGFLMGKIGREKVIPIVENGVELPGDINGAVYVSSGQWKSTVGKELIALGYEINPMDLLREL